MFTVYKITNKINNKCYIGSSVRVEKRWQEHIRESKNPNSKKYHYPLYQAFRKYGLDNFTFEVLNDDFDSAEEMQDFEKEQILKFEACNSNKGYNQTLNTHPYEMLKEYAQKNGEKKACRCAKVDEYNKILEIYNSYHDAARQNIQAKDPENNASLIREICKGKVAGYHGVWFRDLDENNNVIEKPMKSPHGKKPIIAINVEDPAIQLYFSSVTETAEKLHTDRSSVAKCISGNTRYTIVKGYILRELDFYGNIIENDVNIEERILRYNEEHPEINGERHTIAEWCNILGITRETVWRRRKKGMSLIEALTTPKKK